MSLKAWKDEYYPTEAKDVPAADALAHSLRKWIGLRKENLERHGLCAASGDIHEHGSSSGGAIMIVAASSCALCRHWLDWITRSCADCPLNELLGHPCDYGLNNPYAAWVHQGDPEPMIRALEGAIEKEKSRGE